MGKTRKRERNDRKVRRTGGTAVGCMTADDFRNRILSADSLVAAKKRVAKCLGHQRTRTHVRHVSIDVL
jgi:hypothetical protein